MRNLFYKEHEKIRPLAYRLRPTKISEYVGQGKLMGEDSVLRRLIKNGKMVNSIFYGPPGTGKTSLAELIANELDINFEKLNATTANLKELGEVVARAKKNLEMGGDRTILFLDEIHRFNKLQQDALLPHTENGLLILVGATTENPYYTLNNALLSRCMVFEFEKLGTEDIMEMVKRGFGELGLGFDEDVAQYISELADGDARVAINYLELLSNLEGNLDIDEIKKIFEKRKLAYDKKDDKYNIISAFIKSIRGSDPDSAVYWLARMLEGGEDPRYIARRLIISASEDIGMANPEALLVANAAMHSAEKIGMPEVRIILSHATVYLAISSKSNSVYMAINDAMGDVRDGEVEEVPKHLRDQYKELYVYPHAYPGNFVNQKYRHGNKIYYKPGENKYENMIKQKMEKLWDKDYKN